jgi:hypothetical protein
VDEVRLLGDDALRLAAQVLPRVTLGGAGRATGLDSVALLEAAREMWRRRVVIDTRLADGSQLKVRRAEAADAQLRSHAAAGWALRLELKVKPSIWRGDWSSKDRVEEVRLVGDDALRLAGQILPRVNAAGAGRGTVQDSVALLEEARDPQLLLREIARGAMRESGSGRFSAKRSPGAIAGLPAAQRLALEMAVNEDVERRALEGELQLLEAAWRDAEEVAQIADDMFLPEGIAARLERLRRGD